MAVRITRDEMDKRAQKEGHVKPEWFGARSDGSRDSTEAFKKAIAVAGRNKAKVKLGDGTYVFTGEQKDIPNQ